MRLLRLCTTIALLGISSVSLAQISCRTDFSETPSSTEARYPDVSRHQFFQLFEFSQTLDFKRTSRMKEFWRRYKNTAGPRSVLIDLTDKSLFGPSSLLNSYTAKTKTTRYDEVVTLLRKGDRLKLGNEIYVLGDFLGAGNTTHIYVNASDPRTVIRIPYIVSSVIEEKILNSEKAFLVKPESFWRDPRIRTLMGWFFNYRQKDIHDLPNAARLHKLDPYGRLSIMERVHGTEAANDFIIPLLTADGLYSANQNSAVSFPNSLWSRVIQTNHFLSPSKWPAETTKKMNSLLTAMVANGDAVKEGPRYNINAMSFRQYLFDEQLQQWKVVDFENLQASQVPEAFDQFLAEIKNLGFELLEQ